MRNAPEAERFWAKVAVTPSCWLWTANVNNGGYGTFRAAKVVKAHRYAYEALVGPIPDGLHIDHLCRVRNCVNPAHLEAVTQAENNRRGQGAPAHCRAKTHCPAGHSYDEANTYYFGPENRWRGCRECRAEADRRYKAKHRGLIAA